MHGHQYASPADSGKGSPPPPQMGTFLLSPAVAENKTIGQLSCLFHQCTHAIPKGPTLLTQLASKGPIPKAIIGGRDLSI